MFKQRTTVRPFWISTVRSTTPFRRATPSRSAGGGHMRTWTMSNARLRDQKKADSNEDIAQRLDHETSG